MRKLALLLLLLALAYAAWPVWSAWQLRAAVKARDLSSIESKVDWPLLRTNLKQRIGASLIDDKESANSGILKTLKRTLGPMVADTVIDAAVTPGTLAHVLAGRILMREIARDVPGAQIKLEGEEEFDPLSPRNVRWAFFESPTRFRIEVIDRKNSGERVAMVLALEGLVWRLVDVFYPHSA
jgi:hypothetical protein